MGTPAFDVNAVGAAAVAALRRGDAETARQNFQKIVDSSAVTAVACLGLAVACHALGDDPGMHAALDRTLELDAWNLRALIMKGDGLLKRGDRRGALAFYGQVKTLSPDAAGLSPEAAADVRRAHAAHASLSDDIYGHMQRSLQSSGYDEAIASHRFTQSLSLLSGRAQRYEQEPRSYFMPELPTIAFYPRDMFPWMGAIEAETTAIRSELQGLLDGPNVFAPYIEAEANRPVDRSHSLLKSEDWTACYLVRNGEVVPEIAERCPRTMKVIEAAPLERVKGRAPFVLFSKLTPGAWIRPHTGFLNTRLVCHLPLIVPDGCWFRVGAETRNWEEGKAFAFNDTIEHEARNDGSGTRTVLIFNIWRPELTDEERRLVAALFESVDTA